MSFDLSILLLFKQAKNKLHTLYKNKLFSLIIQTKYNLLYK